MVDLEHSVYRSVGALTVRSEHKHTAEEQDAFTGWRRYYAYLQHAGVRKAIKRRSHRRDRRAARQEVRDVQS